MFWFRCDGPASGSVSAHDLRGLGAARGDRLVASRAPDVGSVGPRPEVARKLRWVALAGAIAGAYLCELPADLLGLAPRTSDAHPRWGGRTLLGGMLLVGRRASKRRLGQRTPTGDAFALPLAAGLRSAAWAGAERLFPGRLIETDSLLALPARLLHGEPRFPAALLEAYFHRNLGRLAAAGEARTEARGVPPGYLAAYALLRLWLETERDVPRPFAGLELLPAARFGTLLPGRGDLAHAHPAYIVSAARHRRAGASRERSAGQRAPAVPTLRSPTITGRGFAHPLSGLFARATCPLFWQRGHKRLADGEQDQGPRIMRLDDAKFEEHKGFVSDWVWGARPSIRRSPNTA